MDYDDLKAIFYNVSFNASFKLLSNIKNESKLSSLKHSNLVYY